MVKHTQTIRRVLPDKLFECVLPFCGVGDERVNFDTLSSLINCLQDIKKQKLGNSSRNNSNKNSNRGIKNNIVTFAKANATLLLETKYLHCTNVGHKH